MKEQILKITKNLEQSMITETEAQNLLSDLFGVIQRSEQLIDFFKWLNDYEELKYTEKGIRFYVDEYLKSINCL